MNTSKDEIFSGNNARTRADMTRSARNNSLKQDYPEVWKDTKQARNECKKSVGANECKSKGLCGEAEFKEVNVYSTSRGNNSRPNSQPTRNRNRDTPEPTYEDTPQPTRFDDNNRRDENSGPCDYSE